jgi:hypothetical protein
MTRIRIASIVAVVMLVGSLAGPASAKWQIASVLQIDIGSVCKDGFNIAWAEPGTSLSFTVVDALNPDTVVVPSRSANLRFAPVPELFGTFPNGSGGFWQYRNSGINRVFYPTQQTPGTVLRIDIDSVSTGQTQAEITVEDCLLNTAFLGFKGIKNPPKYNAVADVLTPTGKIPLVWSMGGNHGSTAAEVFEEGPFRAKIPCTSTGTLPTADTSKPASGALFFRSATGNYDFRWNPPDTLGGCHEVWFRLKYTKLTHRVLFDFR